ncbi:hypothetical protein A4D02_19640 [Niastella koreensis]|uniref:Uncharacterized protein n=2 Tax=Niastella koreensis TaxID=354356 RepID=G8TE03_NIAKG|nr:hypothetical protein [Niastella koreensis]AEW03551.1 hypothetical protein Niako_7337 [Niastella koreensis GR20-10]OQP53910.1 hypothetical protein A4D02_19640 [Niastella koreensis]
MLSDNQHIDDFFRQKEEAFSPDNLPVEANWQQFKTQLNKPGGDPGKFPPGNTHITRSLGLWIIAVVVLLVAINPFRHGKKKITTPTKKQTTVVKNTTRQASTNTDSNYRPAIKYKPLDLSDTISELSFQPTAARNKVPVHEQGPILISAVPAAPVVSNKGNDTVESSSPDATQLLQSFFQQLEKPTQEFYINTDRDTTLVAKEGTRLFVPAHTLINKAGPVKIIVREYYKYEDIIAAKLTTTSNGQQLITGGMVHISAEQDGQPVVIAPQKAITVNIPTNNYDDSMQLFAGQEQPQTNENSTNLNWLPVGPLHNNLNFHDNPKGYELNLKKVEPYNVSYGKKTTARFYVSRGIDIPKSELTDRLKERFGSYYDVIKIKRAPKRTYKNEQLVIDSIPVYDTVKVVRIKNTGESDSARYDRELKEDSFYNAQQSRLAQTYSFTISNFGWFNCDRFMNDPRPKVNVTVNIDKGATAGNHVCLLVFTKNKSIVQGVYWSGQKDYFPQVPAGESAILVTVAVTADKVVSNIHPFTTSDTLISDLIFTPTTPEQFKQKLQPLISSQKQ